MRLFLLILMMLPVLFACSTSQEIPEIRYYLLDGVPASNPVEIDSSKQEIQLLKIALPNYLKQRQLVIKQKQNEIKIANYHSWADDLGESIHRLLIGYLNAGNSVLSYTDDCRECPKVNVAIHHFYPTEQNTVVLSGTIKSTDLNGKKTIENFVFNRALTEDGYDHSVTQMRYLLTELVEKIHQVELK